MDSSLAERRCGAPREPGASRQNTAVLVAALSCLLLSILGCGKESPEGPGGSPVASIENPSESDIFQGSDWITFVGSGNDPEDGELQGDSLVWTSHTDGLLGTGERLQVNDLSAGAHGITLAVTDTRGNSGFDCVTILVGPFEVILVDAGGWGDYLTIGEAIDAAGPADTVLVAPGLYRGALNRALDFSGKSIVLASRDGAASTTLDCEGQERAFYFHSEESPGAIVSGFTIANGSAIDGGGSTAGPTAVPRLRTASSRGMLSQAMVGEYTTRGQGEEFSAIACSQTT